MTHSKLLRASVSGTVLKTSYVLTHLLSTKFQLGDVLHYPHFTDE